MPIYNSWKYSQPEYWTREKDRNLIWIRLNTPGTSFYKGQGYGAGGGYGGYPEIAKLYRGALDVPNALMTPVTPTPVTPTPESPPVYSQLGAMLAQLGLTKLAGAASGPFAPLVGLGLQYGLQQLLGSREPDELRRMTQARAAAQAQALPMLTAQAQGQPTAATRAIMEQVRQQQAASQQAAAMSAGRANQYGTAVAQANQYRASLESANAWTQLLGQQQQQALTGLLQLPAVPMQQALAQQDILSKSNIGTYIQKLLAVPDANLTETQRKIVQMHDYLQSILPKLSAWANIQPPKF